MKTEAAIRLDFHTEKQLTTVYNALAPETAGPTVTRSRVALQKDGTFLVLKVEARDTIALRGALNAYLRWISSLQNVLLLLETRSTGCFTNS